MGLQMGKFRQSVRDISVFLFPDNNLCNVNGFSSNFICALIWWRSALGLLMGIFVDFLTELSARDTSVFSFQDNNFNKSQ